MTPSWAPPAPGRGRPGGVGGGWGGLLLGDPHGGLHHKQSSSAGVLRVAWPVESAGPTPTTALGSLPPKIWVCSPESSRPAPPRAPRRLAVVWFGQPTCSPQSKRLFAPLPHHVRHARPVKSVQGCGRVPGGNRPPAQRAGATLPGWGGRHGCKRISVAAFLGEASTTSPPPGRRGGSVVRYPRSVEGLGLSPVRRVRTTEIGEGQHRPTSADPSTRADIG